jgi:hypothetical protein
MMTEIDVKRIEKEMRLALHQDGLDEILVGLSLGIMAFFFIDFRFSIALIVGCIIQILIKPACRRWITYPRVGFAKLREYRDRIPNGLILVLAITIVVVGAGLFVVSQLRWLLPAYLGIVLAGITLAQIWRTAHVYDYFIAGLFLASGLLGLLIISLGYRPAVATAIQGWGLAGLLIPVGIIRLNIFLRKYSRRSIEDAHGKE